jgi:hypothetical protein
MWPELISSGLTALPAAKLAVEGRDTGLQFGNAFPEAPVVVEEKLDSSQLRWARRSGPRRLSGVVGLM